MKQSQEQALVAWGIIASFVVALIVVGAAVWGLTELAEAVTS